MLQDLLALLSVQFLLAALGSSRLFLHPRDHLKKREGVILFHFAYVTLCTFSFQNP